MENVRVTLPDGNIIELPSGTTVGELASRIGRRLAAQAVIGLVDEVPVDLSFPITKDCRVTILDAKAPEGLDAMRHSAAHVMAQAVKRLFPSAKLAIGPTIENGFYYDFDIDHAFTPEDLEKIEAEMRRIIGEDLPMIREEVSWDEAMDMLKKEGETYKLELLDELDEGDVTFYRQDDFSDMCRGPHVPRTGMIGAFKLLNVAGAYWRGDENRPMLSRIYGTAFPTQKELDEYLRVLEEAAKRDHRLLGRELDMFSIHEEAGAGLIFYHPHGASIRHSIEEFWIHEHIARGYKPVITPHIAESTLWTISGHNEFYSENMYYMSIDEKEYVLKPMNCPGHILIYKTATRSYRDMPIRYCELGTVYRYERSGALHGLLRVRGFTQDDAHIFCTPDQLRDEIIGVIDLTKFMLKSFGFSEYEFFLSTRPEKSVGSDENWERATTALRDALESHELDYTMDPGEGVFYGPKIDIKLKDSLGRLWQGPTIQVDFNLPERFDVNYIGEDGERHRAIMIHRTVLGSMERFMGCLIEQYAGALPVWLAPVQVKILSIGDRHVDYAMRVATLLSEQGFRVETDVRDEKIGYKIRQAQLEKVPYMLVIGDREVESKQVALRTRKGGDQGAVGVDDFANMLRAQVDSRSCKEV